LEQEIDSKNAAISEISRESVETSANAQAQIASARADRAALSQQIAQADLASGYDVTSPLSGTVTALTARLGQSVMSPNQLMVIIPEKSAVQVELYVPPSSAALIEPGQQVRLAIDAYPYQQFGTVVAKISDISATTINRQTDNQSSPVFLVTAILPSAKIRAFGHSRSLSPGMTLTGRIVTGKRNLFEWLFEPIFALQRR
jgi:membrane fusion protein